MGWNGWNSTYSPASFHCTTKRPNKLAWNVLKVEVCILVMGENVVLPSIWIISTHTNGPNSCLRPLDIINWINHPLHVGFSCIKLTIFIGILHAMYLYAGIHKAFVLWAPENGASCMAKAWNGNELWLMLFACMSRRLQPLEFLCYCLEAEV